VDGKPVPVYPVSTQHPDRKYSTAYFDFSGTVTVKIKTPLPLDHLVVQPAEVGDQADGNQWRGAIYLPADKPFNISFEPTPVRTAR